MPFVGENPLVLKPVDDRLWLVMYDVVYEGAKERFPIPAGTITNLADVPRAFTPFVPRYGAYTPPVVLHDLLCEAVHLGTPIVSRRDADGLFRRTLREAGIPWNRRWIMWAAVRAGGRMSDAPPREWLTVLGIGLVALPFYAVPVVLTQAFLWVDDVITWGFRLGMRRGWLSASTLSP